MTLYDDDESGYAVRACATVASTARRPGSFTAYSMSTAIGTRDREQYVPLLFAIRRLTLAINRTHSHSTLLMLVQTKERSNRTARVKIMIHSSIM